MLSIVDGIFWGAALILVGVWFILRHSLPVRIPLVRIIIALLLIYAGVRVLVRGPLVSEKNTVVFSDSTMTAVPGDRSGAYTIVFSRGMVDLSGVPAGGDALRREVNVIFGTGVLKVNGSAPVRIDMSTAFGTIRAPGTSAAAFGDSVFTTPSYREGAGALRVKATAVFGTLTIQE
jgi:hypothetical protein